MSYTSPNIMSPQARRRFNAALHGREIMDLAAEIAEGLERAAPAHYVIGEAERMVILAVLIKAFGRCEFCEHDRVPLVARLDADRDQRVCEICHADQRIPTTYFPA